METKNTSPADSSTPATSVTSQSPDVSRTSSLPSAEYLYKWRKPSRSLAHRNSAPFLRKRR